MLVADIETLLMSTSDTARLMYLAVKADDSLGSDKASMDLLLLVNDLECLLMNATTVEAGRISSDLSLPLSTVELSSNRHAFEGLELHTLLHDLDRMLSLVSLESCLVQMHGSDNDDFNVALLMQDYLTLLDSIPRVLDNSDRELKDRVYSVTPEMHINSAAMPVTSKKSKGHSYGEAMSGEHILPESVSAPTPFVTPTRQAMGRWLAERMGYFERLKNSVARLSMFMHTVRTSKNGAVPFFDVYEMLIDLLKLLPEQALSKPNTGDAINSDLDASLFLEDLEDLLTVTVSHLEGSPASSPQNTYDLERLGEDIAAVVALASVGGTEDQRTNLGSSLDELSLFIEDLELLAGHATSFADLTLSGKLSYFDNPMGPDRMFQDLREMAFSDS